MITKWWGDLKIFFVIFLIASTSTSITSNSNSNSSNSNTKAPKKF